MSTLDAMASPSRDRSRLLAYVYVYGSPPLNHSPRPSSRKKQPLFTDDDCDDIWRNGADDAERDREDPGYDAEGASSEEHDGEHIVHNHDGCDHTSCAVILATTMNINFVMAKAVMIR